MEKTQGVTKQSAARPDNDFVTVGVGPGMEFLYSAVDVTAHTQRCCGVSCFMGQGLAELLRTSTAQLGRTGRRTADY
jgi:hypothetical protein